MCPHVPAASDSSICCVAMSADHLLACSLANAACAIMNVMTTLIFIIVSRLHAFSLLVVVFSFLHALMVLAVNCYFSNSDNHVMAQHRWGQVVATYAAAFAVELKFTGLERRISNVPWNSKFDDIATWSQTFHSLSLEHVCSIPIARGVVRGMWMFNIFVIAVSSSDRSNTL